MVEYHIQLKAMNVVNKHLKQIKKKRKVNLSRTRPNQTRPRSGWKVGILDGADEQGKKG